MATHKVLLLAGDGIGPEVMGEVKKLIAFLNKRGPDTFETEEDLVGGSCYDAHQVSITDATMAKANAADAIIFGSVGGPKWDKVPYDVRPEAGLLRLRKDLALYANLRPAVTYPALADASSLKRELVEGLDIIILRELTGGVYFGEPKTITDLGNGQKRAIDTQVYDTYEIERIGRVAFELARKRKNKVTSMEKRNVMKSGVLWNEVMTALHQREFKDVQLEHQLADSGGMQLVRNPKQFDVVVTDNLFGDMLSDVAAMLTGSLGMLASASLGEVDPKTKKRKALYEPVHGSAPDIAGKGIANPIAMIASFGMALRYSFGLGKQADMIDQAIAAALAKGLRTADIQSPGHKLVGTTEMGDAILAEMEKLGGLAAERAYSRGAGAAREPGIHTPQIRMVMYSGSRGFAAFGRNDRGFENKNARVCPARFHFQDERHSEPRAAEIKHAVERLPVQVVPGAERSGRLIARRIDVVGELALAGQHLGAAIEIGTFLDDDLGAGTAVLAARGEHGSPPARRSLDVFDRPAIDGELLLFRRRVGRAGGERHRDACDHSELQAARGNHVESAFHDDQRSLSGFGSPRQGEWCGHRAEITIFSGRFSGVSRRDCASRHCNHVW